MTESHGNPQFHVIVGGDPERGRPMMPIRPLDPFTDDLQGAVDAAEHNGGFKGFESVGRIPESRKAAMAAEGEPTTQDLRPRKGLAQQYLGAHVVAPYVEVIDTKQTTS